MSARRRGAASGGTHEVPIVVAMAPLPTARGNPFIGQMAAELTANGCTLIGASLRGAAAADVLHFHWPDHFVNRESTWQSVRGAVKVVLMCMVVRARRGAVVWTVHNLKPHDRRHPRVERVFWPVFSRLVSGRIFLTEAGRDLAAPGLRPGSATVVIPHGSYEGVYPAYGGSPLAARQALGLLAESAPLLFFGQIRSYKNVPGLLGAFSALLDRSARLVIAGDGPDRELIESIRSAAAEDGRVLVTGRVDDADVQRITAAAVGVVLPYHDIFNSGSLFLALSMARPVLVPRSEVFSEVRQHVGAAWIEFFDPPLSSDDLVQFTRSAAALVASGTRPDLDAFKWERLGTQIVDFYEALLR